jgi:hypothetical protein
LVLKWDDDGEAYAALIEQGLLWDRSNIA